MHWILVFLGGGLGAAARHGINRAGLALLGPGFPWWTLVINVSGSFLIGLLAGLFGSLPAIVLVHCIFGMPVLTLLFRNYYASVPHELFQAARIDGGGFWRIFGGDKYTLHAQ